MLKNKTLHEKVEQPFNGSRRKTFRAVDADDDMAIHMAVYSKVKGSVRDQLLWMRGQPRWMWGRRSWPRNGNQLTMMEINA